MKRYCGLVVVLVTGILLLELWYPTELVAVRSVMHPRLVGSRYHPATKREMLNDMSRERLYVKLHLDALNDTNYNYTAEETLIVVLGTHSFYSIQHRLAEGPTPCNIPCELTFDRARDSNASVFVMMLEEKEGFVPPFFPGVPLVGVTWENNMLRRLSEPAFETLESLHAQRLYTRGLYPYTAVASYELDSHIPLLYPEINLFIDSYVPESFEDLVQLASKKSKRVLVAISNCDAVIVPNRIHVISQIEALGYPIKSIGRCLPDPGRSASNSRNSDEHITELRKHMFAFVPENSYALDYVTEKIWNALARGIVPIYYGAPNIAAFLPHPKAIIAVADFPDYGKLVTYLHALSANRSLYVERHQAWRSLPLPQHMYDLQKLTDQYSPVSFACKVCNCARGRLGCPSPG